MTPQAATTRVVCTTLLLALPLCPALTVSPIVAKPALASHSVSRGVAVMGVPRAQLEVAEARAMVASLNSRIGSWAQQAGIIAAVRSPPFVIAAATLTAALLLTRVITTLARRNAASAKKTDVAEAALDAKPLWDLGAAFAGAAADVAAQTAAAAFEVVSTTGSELIEGTDAGAVADDEVEAPATSAEAADHLTAQGLLEKTTVAKKSLSAQFDEAFKTK